MFLQFVLGLALLACELECCFNTHTKLTCFRIFSIVTLIFHGVASCRQHKYNQIGTNKEAKPIDIAPKHPQYSTAYQGAAGYQSLA